MKKLCIVSKVPIFPENTGNRTRIKTLVVEYRRMGLDVHFLWLECKEEVDLIAMNQFFGDRFISVAKNFPLPLYAIPIKVLNKFKIFFYGLANVWKNHLLDAWYPFRQHETLIKELKQIRPDIIQIEYVYLSYLFRFFPSALKILDTHDTHVRRNEFLGENVWLSLTEAEEKKALLRSDVVMAITENDKVFFESISKHPRVLTVGHIMNGPAIKSNPSEKTRIGFIGSKNLINYKAVSKLLDDFACLNKDKYTLLIAGSIVNKLAINSSSGIKLVPFMTLEDFYSNIDIAYNPTEKSTGLKIKNVEALYHDKVLITSHDGAQGLEEGAGKHFFCTEDFKDLNHILSQPNLFELNGRHFIDLKIQEWRESLESIVLSKKP